MEDNRQAQVELRRMHRLLRQIARLAEHASMTGSLEKGARSAVRQYNAIAQNLERLGVSPGDLFPLLNEEEVSFDELGVASALLASYIEEEVEAAEAAPQAAPTNVNAIISRGEPPENQELRAVGELIREHLPELLTLKAHLNPDEREAERAQREQQRAEREAERGERDAERARMEQRIAELEKRLAEASAAREPR